MSQTPEAIYRQVRGFLHEQKAAEDAAPGSSIAGTGEPAGVLATPDDARSTPSADEDQDECDKPCPAAHSLWMQDHIDDTPDRTYHGLKAIA